MKHTTWFKIAAVFQLLTAIAHAIGFFNEPVPANDTEKMLIDLMSTYKMDLGSGFHRSMNELLLALSSCFSLLYLFAALLNWHLLRKKTDPGILRGVILVNVIIFGICFAIMAYFTFLPPIVLTGLVFLFLLISLVAVPKTSPNA